MKYTLKHLAYLLAVLAFPLLAMGQNQGQNQNTTPNRPAPRPYQPAVAAPSTTVYGGGGGYGYSSPGTAQGAALQGMSQVISAQGQYNLNTSAAAINMTQAQSNALNNDVQGVQTFWAMRDIGRAEREKERGPRLSTEQLTEMAHQGAPKPLGPRQMDPVSGRLIWADALQAPDYNDQRTALDGLFAKWVNYGALGYEDRQQVRTNVETMDQTLLGQIAEIPPQNYVNAKSYLKSLLYAATKTSL